MRSNVISINVTITMVELNIKAYVRENGRIYETSAPIYVNDVYRGNTPLTISLTSGKYKFYVSPPSLTVFDYWYYGGKPYYTNPAEITVSPVYTTLSAYLKYTGVNLRVETWDDVTLQQVSGVKVWIDNVEYRSPVEIGVIAGSHTVKIDPAYFVAWEDNSTANPRTFNITSSTTLRAWVRVYTGP